MSAWHVPLRFDRRGTSRRRARSFTLAELMVVMSIVTVLASAVLFALWGVMDDAKEARTRAQINKLHELVMIRWEEYRTRPVRIGPTSNPRLAAEWRLIGLRQVMRMELPDRKTDILDDGFVPGLAATTYRTPLQNTYRRHALATLSANGGTWNDWTESLQGAECLYLIAASIRDDETTGLDFLQPTEIGDTDADGMFEILDGWGRPIEFLRWAPGYTHMPGPDGAWGVGGVDDDGNGTVDDLFERGWVGSDDEIASDIQGYDAAESPDPFDPLRVDRRWTDGDPTSDPYAIYPLIYSAGRDNIYDIAVDYDMNPATPVMDHFQYSATLPWANDPYHLIPTTPPQMIGLPVDSSGGVPSGGNGILECLDNITNHQLGIQ